MTHLKQGNLRTVYSGSCGWGMEDPQGVVLQLGEYQQGCCHSEPQRDKGRVGLPESGMKESCQVGYPAGSSESHVTEDITGKSQELTSVYFFPFPFSQRAREEVGEVPPSQPPCRDQKDEWWVQRGKQTRHLPPITLTKTILKAVQKMLKKGKVHSCNRILIGLFYYLQIVGFRLDPKLGSYELPTWEITCYPTREVSGSQAARISQDLLMGTPASTLFFPLSVKGDLGMGNSGF